MSTETQNAVWTNDNGTFSHHKDPRREWANLDDAETDLQFWMEWQK